ncbi:MAG: RluA family pseudouridine synthase [bacterium]
MLEDEYFEFVVPTNKDKERLDKFLARKIAAVSRARLQKIIQEGKVVVNGYPAKASHLVQPDEKIILCIPKPKKVDILPEKIPLKILYEDQHLLVLNKEAGMVVHPAFSNYTGTLVNALLYHCGGLSTIGGRQRPGIVHRLDKDTSGLMVIAKNDITHRHLSQQFSEKETERKYMALAWGQFKKKQGKIATNIARSPRDRKRMSVQINGKLAVTNYEVIQEFSLLSLLTLKLETGRTHQIRVHLSYLGHPVFGDMTYGGRNRQLGGLSKRDRQHAVDLLELMPRQALHAKTLGFTHPINNEFMRFDSELPPDMQLLLIRLRKELV